MSSEDAQLIARVQFDGSHAAYGELVRRHQSSVRSFLRHLTRGDHSLADDLAQETFVTAYRTLHRFRGEAAWSTWLLGIAYNQWRNARRRPPAASAQVGATEPVTPDATAAADLRHDLALALGRLSPDEQTAIHLAYREGLTHQEIAATLHWPLGTVKTHLLRGKAKLRDLLFAWNPLK